MRVARGQIADRLGRKIQLHRIPKRLGEKQYALPVMRPVRPLTEPRYPGDVRQQMVHWTFPGLGFRGGSAQRGGQAWNSQKKLLRCGSHFACSSEHVEKD